MQKLKETRTASFIVIIAIYILAIITGVLVYRLLNFDWWINLLMADITATIVTFIFSLILKNSSVYDAYWSVQPIVILIAYSIGKTPSLLQVMLFYIVCCIGDIKLSGSLSPMAS